jgi:hypothetical protein
MIGTAEKKYAKDHDWVGAGGVSNTDEGLLSANRDKVEILAEVSDDNLSYEFDMMAICYLRGHGYFICQATGCSCPSPSETWGVVKRFRTRKQVMKAIEDGEYQGYTLPSYAVEDLRTQLLDE